MDKLKMRTYLAVLLVVLLLIFSAALYERMEDKQANEAYWYYAADNLLCIGDSLTDGTYFGSDYGGDSIEQNYPWYLSRMLNTEVTNAGASGRSPSDWYKEFHDSYDYSDYNVITIWLGTNYAPTNTLAEDVEAFSSPEDYAETETGYYCRIIEDIRKANPDCVILLMNIFASKSDVAEANIAIAAIAEHYGLPLLDMSDIGGDKQPEYHAGLQNPHFGKAGNVLIASRIVEALGEYFAEAPLRCEFGITRVEE
ncbi:MAG: SGNH/GDSL hydrolase family protein [Oscillospiraceae bacterium]|nr:SGNH/GDSL hydrolase family protein [Oscillospiraceae bacterium]